MILSKLKNKSNAKKDAKQAPLKFVTNDGQPYEIPVEGSLGLLATGYEGIMAWRLKRKEVLDQKLAKTIQG